MKSSDSYPEPDITADGSLAPASTATDSPTDEVVDGPDAKPSPSNPDALIEGNRVATAKDME